VGKNTMLISDQHIDESVIVWDFSRNLESAMNPSAHHPQNDYNSRRLLLESEYGTWKNCSNSEHVPRPPKLQPMLTYTRIYVDLTYCWQPYRMPEESVRRRLDIGARARTVYYSRPSSQPEHLIPWDSRFLPPRKPGSIRAAARGSQL
jgi:hypothetical protein